MFALAEGAIESVLPARDGGRRPTVGASTGLVFVGVLVVLGLLVLVQVVS